MLSIRFCLLGAAGAVLSACAPTPPPPKPAPPPASPGTTDGVYVGTTTRFQADSRACPHPGVVTLYVQNARFSYRWDYSTWVDSSIDPDGTVRGAADRITLLGKWEGKHMDGDVTNGTCGLHFTVTRHNS